MMRSLRTLRHDRRGLALLEFALALPIVLPIGLYAIELSNFGVRQLQLSQATLALADNASRVGIDTPMATQQLREVDINEIFQGLRLQTEALRLTSNGRVTISSLETRDGAQWIHWQRCIGMKRGAGYESSFGRADDGGRAGTSFRGMGHAGSLVMAPPNAAVIFVEVNYDYTPLISSYFLGDRKLQQIASFIVRDTRELAAGVVDPAPAASERMTCNRFTT